ncbi:MAG: hypothetical protein GX078_01750 [Clostridiales bacterium]|nr:hypothetical protein [Clostridiales bacterium]
MGNKVKMIAIGLGITAIMDLITVKFIDEPKSFVLGSFVGIIVALINIFLLEIVINGAMGKGNVAVAAMLEFVRLALYVSAALIMYKISLYAVTGYALGVVILTLTLTILYRKGTSDEL